MEQQIAEPVFSGNVFIFQAFDVGDDIDLVQLRQSKSVLCRPFVLSKYFKNYHAPLAIDIPHPHQSSKCISSKVHNFGVISLAYKIPFHDTLENLRKMLNEMDHEYNEQSVADAHIIFKRIKPFIKQARFFHLRTSYYVIQIDPQPSINTVQLKEQQGGVIASLLRFETENLSEYQKNEILDAAMGYYRGDLYIIDIDAAFIYDEEYEDILDLFEFANIQHLELQYYDRVLDQQLNAVYQREVKGVPFKAYLPFIGSMMNSPMSSLSNLKVDVSVIIERLGSSIKIAGEAYVSELYTLLAEKLDLKNWNAAIDRKLQIIKEINTVYQDKLESVREDILSISIILLVFVEAMFGILSYFFK